MLKKYLDGYWQYGMDSPSQINHYELFSDPKSEFDGTITAILEISPDTIMYINDKMYFHIKIIHKKLAICYEWDRSYNNKKRTGKAVIYIDFLSDTELITVYRYTAFRKEKQKSIKRTEGNFIK